MPRAAWERRTTRSLFVFLLTSPGRVFLPEEIGRALWPDRRPEALVTNLQSVVSRLRKALDPGLRRGSQSRYVVTESGGYLLTLSPRDRLDIRDVEAARDAGDDARRQERWDEAADQYRRALALYRGDFAADLRDADWVIPHREHWRGVRQSLRLGESECRLALGHYSAAVESCRLILEEDPSHESAYRHSMLCHYAAGRLSEAEALFRQCRTVLQRELATEPSEETLTLYEQIRRRRVPGLDRVGRAPVSVRRAIRPPHSLGRLPLVGRDPEMAGLVSALEKIHQAPGRLVIIEGEAGIGKTRLAEEVLVSARSRSILTATGRCYAPALRQPYEPIADIIRQVLRSPSRDVLLSLAPLWRACAAAVVPELGSTGVAPPPVSSPEQERRRIGDALTELVVGLSVHVPLALLLDDVHWVDDETIRVLAALAGRLSEARLLLLVTYRAEDVRANAACAQWLDTHARPPAQTLSLATLAPGSVEELLAAMRAKAQPPAEIARLAGRLHAETGGHPLGLIEVLQTLFERGALTVNGRGKWLISAEGKTWLDTPRWLIPLGISRIVQARVERLAAGPRHVLEALSTLDRPFTSDLAARLSGASMDVTWACLDDLVRERLLAEDGELAGAYRFVHDHVRRAVYDALPPGRRKACHREVAMALESLTPGGATPGELAHHFLEAEAWAKGFSHLMGAADAAQRAYAFGAAASWLDRGRRLLDERGAAFLPPADIPGRRLDLLRRAASVFVERGDAKARGLVGAHLVDLLDALREPSERAAAYLALADLYSCDHEWAAAIDAATQSLAAYEQCGDPLGQAAAHRERGYALWQSGRLTDALEANQRALALHEAAGHSKGMAGDLHNLGQIYVSLGNPDQAVDCYRRARRIFRALGSPQEESCTLNVLPHLFRTAGHPAEALANSLEALELAREAGNTHGELVYRLNVASLWQVLGQDQAAVEAYEAALITASAMGGKQQEEGHAYRGLGGAYERLGDASRAEACWTRAADRLSACGDQASRADVCQRLGDLFFSREQTERAAPWYRSALDALAVPETTADAERVTWRLAMRLGHCEWTARRAHEAVAWYSEAFRAAQRGSDQAGEASAWGALSVAYREVGALNDSREACHRALAIVRSLGDRVAEGMMLSSLADTRLALGDLEGAEAAARAALESRVRTGPDSGAEAWARYRLARVFNAAGKVSEGREEIEAARSLAVEANDQALLAQLTTHEETYA